MLSPEIAAEYAVTALFTVLNLLVTYFVLKRFLFKPIIKVLKKRKEDIENEVKMADERMADAESKLANARQKLDSSSHDAAEIISNARTQADSQAESVITEAKQEATAIMSRAETETARLRVAMLNEVRDEVADLSVSIASKVIGHVMDDKRQKELVQTFLDEEMKPVDQKAGDKPSEVNENV